LSLTADERAAIRYYTALGYLHLNACLRNGSEPDANLAGYLEAIDRAVAKSAVSEETIVYRGYPKWYFDFLKRGGLGVGSVLYDDAFMSTSKAKQAAEIFAEWPDGLMVRIRIPAGSKGLDVTPYSQSPEEQEILLPRGTGLRIMGYDDTTRILDAEVA
jgi:hypothetical protein